VVQVGTSADAATSNRSTDARPSSTEPAPHNRFHVDERTGTLVPQTTIPSSQGLGFTESFDSASARERFRFGVHHRDDILVGDVEWVGDYDPACSSPTGQRVISRENPDQFIYICQGRLLTAIGDTAGYSTAFFSPRMIFGPERSLSWQASITDLGLRQWWEVAILPVEANDLVAISWLSPSPSSLKAYPDDAVVVGIGPFAGDFRVTAGGTTVEPFTEGICDIDPDGCATTELRVFTVMDNSDGTITVEALGRTTTLAGSFPEAGFKVVFNDHNYTPDKGLEPTGYTWHWDEIAIR